MDTEDDEIRYLFYSQQSVDNRIAMEKAGELGVDGPLEAKVPVAEVPNGRGGVKEVMYTLDTEDPDSEMKFPDSVLVWSGRKSEYKYLRMQKPLPKRH